MPLNHVKKYLAFKPRLIKKNVCFKTRLLF